MVTQLILATGIAIIVSAFCSIIEAVLYSVSQSQVEVMAKSGKKSGFVLKELKKDIRQPITAILTLNTIANTMGAAVAGASAAVVFGEENLVWFSIFFTLAILLFSEILPKTAGVAYAKNLASWIAIPLNTLTKIMSPLIWLCQVVTHLIPKQAKEALVSIEEIQAVAMLGRKAGKIEPQQEKVIANILKLQDKTVREVMTPQTVVFTLNENLTIAEALKFKEQWNKHSRVPVYEENHDDVVGLVLSRNVLLNFAEGMGEKKLSDLMQPVHFVPEAAPLNKIMIEFFEQQVHLFVVVDEYGSVTGVISLEDIIEEIVGREIIDESDTAGDLREYARHRKKLLRKTQK
ncbi:MAG: hemolysin family protein [Desulfobacterales bacterium]|nr:hemolysin family protein [Desulfobacterales bacterium]